MIVNGHGTCVNYSYQTYLVCEGIGLECYGCWTDAEIYGHTANIVKVEGIWYVLDTQAGGFLDYNYGFTEVIDKDENHVADGSKTETDHAWIYMGEFDSRDEVVSYLKNIGVPETLITAQTVGSGNGGGGKHWRIESNGSQGVVINNNVDGKSSSAFECSAFRITQREVTFEIKKVYIEDNTVEISGTSPIDGTKAVYGVILYQRTAMQMKKITFNAPLNHKAYSYEPMQIEVEKVIPL